MRWNAGFTVLELLMTLAIMAVIAAIAVPSYKEFKNKTHISAAKSQLGDLYSLQKLYYQEFNNYTVRLYDIGYIPMGTYYFDHGNFLHQTAHKNNYLKGPTGYESVREYCQFVDPGACKVLADSAGSWNVTSYFGGWFNSPVFMYISGSYYFDQNNPIYIRINYSGQFLVTNDLLAAFMQP